MAQMAVIPHFDVYSHLPLLKPRSFRLVDLAPGNYGDPLQCTFSTFQLHYPPAYEALSYTWGDHVLSHHVQVGSSQLPINANLDLALRRLRHREIKRRLWVDAICIDQKNVKERETQIRCMLRIYQGAQRVVIYLGEDADGSEQMPKVFSAMAYMRAMAKSIPTIDANPDATLHHLDHTTEITCLNAGSSAWAAVRAFYGRPWMRRVWVVQEVIAARDLVFVCGNWQLPRDIVQQAVFSSLEYPQMDPFVGRTVDDREEGLIQLFRMLILATNATVKNSGRDLIKLLTLVLGTKASDRRDHLYGVLGLAQEAEAQELSPDYTVLASHLPTVYGILHKARAGPESPLQKLFRHCFTI